MQEGSVIGANVVEKELLTERSLIWKGVFFAGVSWCSIDGFLYRLYRTKYTGKMEKLFYDPIKRRFTSLG